MLAGRRLKRLLVRRAPAAKPSSGQDAARGEEEKHLRVVTCVAGFEVAGERGFGCRSGGLRLWSRREQQPCRVRSWLVKAGLVSTREKLPSIAYAVGYRMYVGRAQAGVQCSETLTEFCWCCWRPVRVGRVGIPISKSFKI